jgi:hypothetical protein
MQNTWVQKENGVAVQYPIEQAIDSYKTEYGIDSSEAFTELKKMSPVITRSFILAFLGKEFNQIYRNGFVHKHFHPPAKNLEFKYVANSRKYLFHFYENAISLNEVLKKAGAKLVHDKEKCDIDLSPEVISKDSIINLLKKEAM